MSDYIIKYLSTCLFFAALFLPFFYLIDQKHKIPQRKIQKKDTDIKVIKKEFVLSVITSLIFMFFVVAAKYIYSHDMGLYYHHIMDKGILYFIFTIVVLILISSGLIPRSLLRKKSG